MQCVNHSFIRGIATIEATEAVVSGKNMDLAVNATMLVTVTYLHITSYWQTLHISNCFKMSSSISSWGHTKYQLITVRFDHALQHTVGSEEQ